MKRDTPYGGSRFEIKWEFQKKPQSEPLRLDLCTGDDVDPAKIRLSEIEFIFAEKLETLARFGTGNTRLKHFIDLWNFTCLESDRFSKSKCEIAIRRCFARRKTEMDLKLWQEILLDTDFQEIMEETRQRNFSGLPIPAIPVLFEELAAYLTQLKLP
jgi:hypothetical protein